MRESVNHGGYLVGADEYTICLDIDHRVGGTAAEVYVPSQYHAEVLRDNDGSITSIRLPTLPTHLIFNTTEPITLHYYTEAPQERRANGPKHPCRLLGLGNYRLR